jgi:hypothetical protein
MSEFVRSIHAAADRLAGQRGGDFSIRLILKPRGATAGQFTLGWSSRPLWQSDDGIAHGPWRC